MGLTDRLKDIGKQAQGVVAEHKDEIQSAVGAVGSAANQRTHGKYADRIARAGGKLSATVDKLGGSGETPAATADTAAATADAAPPAADGAAAPAGQPAAAAAPDGQPAAAEQARESSSDHAGGEPPAFA